MASINELCESMVTDVADAVAANVVDLSSGMMLGGHFTSNFTTDHFEAVSAAATSLYRGKETLRVEDLVKAQRGDTTDDHYIEEVQMTTKMHFHFMKKIEGKEAILCLVTKTTSNLGMGWSAVKGNIKQFESLIPS